MSDIAISVDRVSKMYRLGEVGTGTISHDLNRWWHKVRGKDDPYLKLGEENKRDSSGGKYVWALKDISFDVNQGEVLGIIGKNGAGKSTLLKLLSRVTAPTEGTIRARGRIASLLEVGTGFHPELTGRENIFLNGAILGMTRPEIKRKFDEILDFSGVERYVDTPVKRYSSGMYVRLAFAVAAFLEPEILIVDEVLAVGDAEFQKKCLGRMKDVSVNDGRTVLFVSHNMGAIKNLCRQTLVMKHGMVESLEETPDAIERYLSSDSDIDRCILYDSDNRPGDNQLRLEHIKILDSNGTLEKMLTTDDDIYVEVSYEVLADVKDLRISVSLLSFDGEQIFITSDFKYQSDNRIREAGKYISRLKIPARMLNVSKYYVSLDIEVPKIKAIVKAATVAFNVDELVHNELGIIIGAKPPGLIHPVLDWTVEKQ